MISMSAPTHTLTPALTSPSLSPQNPNAGGAGGGHDDVRTAAQAGGGATGGRHVGPARHPRTRTRAAVVRAAVAGAPGVAGE